MGNSLTKQLPEPGLGLHKFRLLRVIGRGSFGKVRIVEHRDSNKAYALKYISKATCIRMKAHSNTVRERDMLEEIDHPFVVNLRFSFQDEFSMFMVMDLMIGGDLRFHMMRRRFVEGVIKFWIAELACAIHYLHTSHSIVHRDIKPDNILMDHRGHVALTDFNIATRISNNAPHYSVAGTANYMAPEVVSGSGYTFSIDWWSLGVVMYECVYGKRPFRHKKSADDLRRALLYEEIQFPIIADVQVSYDCISAMRGFLHKDPAQRLGCGPSGLDSVKAHPFFAAINWEALELKLADPPFVPNAEQSNFDISHDLEEMLLEPEPLDARKRVAMKRHKTPAEHAQPEYLDIARSFAAFDFIEYERFKSYIDTHGSISAFAVDAARFGTSTTNALAMIKLDGRPIFNHDPQPPPPPFATISTSPIARSSRTSTAHAASIDSAAAPRISSNQRNYKHGSSSSDARNNNAPTQPLPPLPTTQQQIPQWAIGALVPSRSASIVANSNITSSTTSTATTTSTPVVIAESTNTVATTTIIASDGTLEPPAIVPIDILTWNQLLPEQRQLAHRFCIKMVHDRQRLLQTNMELQRRRARALSPIGTATSPHHIPSSRDTSHFHRQQHMPSSLAITGLTHTYSSQHIPQLAHTQAPPPTTTATNTDLFLTAREKRQSVMKRQRSADNLPCIATTILPTAIDYSHHYQHQPLPQLPELAPSQPLL
ncbi:hypothetical protein GGI08_002396 [Coemansia sp. S2]|nr:hypothetical protein GGI14_001666 [Coemansia sp. S680]KAJ2032680.1 hypothetical protein H4S03_006139 [Coemansia sp. S3946]KAJ2064395.1 hypothetical protein GGI08_002396 [Coemansia sp. S2]KAJ2344863.1 hypothetical protein GGH92_004304 [Coemansia sp. RSA 2673]